MVYIFENVQDFEERLQTGPDHLRHYLRKEFEPLLDREDFEKDYMHIFPVATAVLTRIISETVLLWR